jgi:hypothetical protein
LEGRETTMDMKRDGHASCEGEAITPPYGEGGLETLAARFLAFDMIVVLLAFGVSAEAMRQGAVLLGGLLMASSGVLLAGVIVSVGAVIAFTGVRAVEGHRPDSVAAHVGQVKDAMPDA